VTVSWDEDPPGYTRRIVDNLAVLSDEIEALANSRQRPSIAMAVDWHRRAYAGIPLPVDYFAGNVRGDPGFPELVDYEVEVAGMPGASAAEVEELLVAFEEWLRLRVELLDERLRVGEQPSTADDLRNVLWLAAEIHGMWIRIHPFANGNGRIARLWVRWIAVRYGLPPFLELKPRPQGEAYDAAAEASMSGTDLPMLRALADALSDYVAER